jgi:hypothetical protein
VSAVTAQVLHVVLQRTHVIPDRYALSGHVSTHVPSNRSSYSTGLPVPSTLLLHERQLAAESHVLHGWTHALHSLPCLY